MDVDRNPVLDFEESEGVDPILRDTYAALPAVRWVFMSVSLTF